MVHYHDNTCIAFRLIIVTMKHIPNGRGDRRTRMHIHVHVERRGGTEETKETGTEGEGRRAYTHHFHTCFECNANKYTFHPLKVVLLVSAASRAIFCLLSRGRVSLDRDPWLRRLANNRQRKRTGRTVRENAVRGGGTAGNCPGILIFQKTVLGFDVKLRS